MFSFKVNVAGMVPDILEHALNMLPRDVKLTARGRTSRKATGSTVSPVHSRNIDEHQVSDKKLFFVVSTTLTFRRFEQPANQ